MSDADDVGRLRSAFLPGCHAAENATEVPKEQRNQLASVFLIRFFFCVKGAAARLELGGTFSCSHVGVEAQLFFLF